MAKNSGPQSLLFLNLSNASEIKIKSDEISEGSFESIALDFSKEDPFVEKSETELSLNKKEDGSYEDSRTYVRRLFRRGTFCPTSIWL